MNLCIHPGCVNEARNKVRPGYCSKHATRMRKHGDPGIRNIKRRARGPYCVLFIRQRKNPYWATKIKGRDVYIHRLLVEMKLGRKLHTHEQVHHKDHNSLNNSMSNLEIVFAETHGRQSAYERYGKGEPF